MIKKIICPTDFSSAATNAVEYAARLSQRLGASLTLLHVQEVSISEGVSLFSGGERESVSGAKVAAKALDDICLDINRIFKISCDHEIIPSMGVFEKVVAEESRKYDLAIIGTNGADTIFQYYFGTHSFKVSKNSSIPVLIIPDEYSYHDFSNVVFASDYNKGDHLLLQELKQFTDVFKPHLAVIHISERDTGLSRQMYSSFMSITEEALNYDNKITFERLVHENVASSIENFVKNAEADLLAISMEEHGFIYRLFHKSLLKNLASYTDIPILVLHK